MRCLTPAEVSSWLSAHELPADPYHQVDASPTYYLQREIPRDNARVSAFTRDVLAVISNGEPVLILMSDWDHYQTEDMQEMTAVRLRCGETRPLIEAPGHLLEPSDVETTVELFTFAAEHEWTCWLHAPADECVFLCWEGVLLDFWTGNPEKLTLVQQLADTHGFSVPPLPPS